MKDRFRYTFAAAVLSLVLIVPSFPVNACALPDAKGVSPVDIQEQMLLASAAGEGETAPEKETESVEGTEQETESVEGTEAGEETGTATEAAEQDPEDGSELWPEGPPIVGEAGILMEVSTGTILYSKNIHARYYPASITKILTALIVIENCDMDEIVTIPHEAVYMEDKGSHIALDEGEELTVKDCLYGILLASANDAAYALAIHVGGTIEGFADMMNRRAKELGCVDSHFVNPHGLPDEAHVSSAYDMALITREALKHDIFREISGTVFYEIQPTDKQPDLIPMSNHHDMLTATKYHYDGVFAGKTGYTVVAKNTLVTCAARDDMELICVTMKTDGKQVYLDTAALFDFGFESFKKLDVGECIPQTIETAVYDLSSGGGESPDQEPVRTEEIPVQIEEDGCVVVPAEVSFGQLIPELYYDAADGHEGDSTLLEYHYGDRTVGSVQIGLPQSLAVPEEPESVEVEETVPQQEEEVQKPRQSAFNWWFIPLGIVIAAAAGGIGYLIVRRQVWKYRWRKRRGQRSNFSRGRRSGRKDRGFRL